MLLTNLFDSHVHLLETGFLASSLDLTRLIDVTKFAQLPREPRAFRGAWLIGFGWDETKWRERRLPTAADLDVAFADIPVYFSRADGHAGVTNTRGLELLGRTGSGHFREREHYENLARLPKHSFAEIKEALRVGARRMNEAGFTHVREMGGFPEMWEAARELENAGEWTVHLDWNFSCENLMHFRELLPWVKSAAPQSSELNKVLGIKMYYDGSLGSETAWLSQPYANRNDGACGAACWSDEDALAVIRETWEAGLEVAVHAIGDAAADRIVDLARKVSASGIAGRLNIEHAQILRPETIQKMKPLHVVCHLQPCHWLTDQRWLPEKLGSLMRYAFPWEALRRARIPFQFGSDSPIERPSLARNLQALSESAKQRIPGLAEDPLPWHTHAGAAIGETLLDEEGHVFEVKLRGKTVFSADRETGSASP